MALRSRDAAPPRWQVVALAVGWGTLTAVAAAPAALLVTDALGVLVGGVDPSGVGRDLPGEGWVLAGLSLGAGAVVGGGVALGLRPGRTAEAR